MSTLLRMSSIYDKAEREELIIETSVGVFTFHGRKEELKSKLSQERMRTKILSARYCKYSMTQGISVLLVSENWS